MIMANDYGHAQVDPGAIGPDHPNYGAYIVAFRAPTWKDPNATSGDNTTSGANATATGASLRASVPELGDAEAELPHHHRRLLAMHEQGTKDVTWGQVEDLLSSEPWAAEQLSAARALLAPEDVIFYAHPGAANAARRAANPFAASEAGLTGRQLHALKLASPDHPEHAQTVAAEERRVAALADTQVRLSALAGHPGFAEAEQRGAAEFAEAMRGPPGRRSRLTTRAITNSSDLGGGAGVAAGGGAARELTLKEKAERPLIDKELEYLVFWVDITKFVQNRWGYVEDALLNEYTRLFDFNGTAGFMCPEESPYGQAGGGGLCGIKQLIARQEFVRIDGLGNADGRLQRAEVEAAFPPDGRAAYRKGWDWDKAEAYGVSKGLGGNGLAMRAWEEAYGASQPIFDASLKDPLVRNYWTVCGLNRTATPLVISGNVSREVSRFEWLGYKSFDMDEKGRLTRAIKGLPDDNNNVFVVNVVVRHVVTKEMVAYKPHVLQRRTPIYEPADATGPQQMTLIYAAAGAGVGLTLLFIAAVLYSRTRKTRPTLRVVKHGPAGPLLAEM